MKKLLNIFSITILVAIGTGLFSSCKKTAIDVPTNLNGASDTTAVPDSSYFYIKAYYPFNESGYDYSGGSNNLSFSNISSVADRNGISDGAYYFNGVNSSAHANSPALNLSNISFTINVWINLESYGGAFGSAIVGKRGVGPGNGWMLSVTNAVNGNATKSGLLCYMSGSTDKYAVDTTVIDLHKWCMVTVMYDNKLKKSSFYINGVLRNVVDNIKTPAAVVTADMYIARDNPLNTSEGYFFNGSMDDLRVYSRMITVSELRKLMARTD
jgi:hypothetical protein